jgi:hypothetical protein
MIQIYRKTRGKLLGGRADGRDVENNRSFPFPINFNTIGQMTGCRLPSVTGAKRRKKAA